MRMDSSAIPSIFSWKFHVFGIPRLLRARILGLRTAAGASSRPHARLELIFALVACLGLAAATAQSARNGSSAGIFLLALAVAGLLALAVQSAWSARSYPLLPERFAIGPFIACMILGFDIGLAVGRGSDVTQAMRIVYGAAGVLAGYLTGGVAGLFAQRLGWLAPVFSLFSFAASAGLILLAVVLFV
jgi:hypothetical protein